MNFNKFTLGDKELLEKYIYPYRFLSCEYSFTTLYIWREACDIQYGIYKDALIIKKKDFKGNYHFMQPLGYKEEDLKDILKYLSKYKKENNMKYIFKDLEEDFVQKIKDLCKENQDISIIEDIDNFDYLYESEKLIKLSGKKLHRKKNHYNSFVREYDYKIKDINGEEVITAVINATEKWYSENKNDDKMLYYETKAIKDIAKNIEFLNLKGMAVYIDDEVVGFTLGEKLNDKLAVIHVEKGDINYKGIYSFINRTFIDKYFSDVEIINREQDLGIEGLRKAKLSYSPLKLEKKFIISCKKG